MRQNIYSKTLETINQVGLIEKEFPISIGPRFLELFSENLYSSPNKAFEELVANSWDADATSVYISMPDDLHAQGATISVLDNGTSMDATGLETLWTITSGHKRSLTNTNRPQIGKFGIGKLATYILASEITYICKGSDGNIRVVALDYREIEDQNQVWDPNQSPLSIKIISEQQLENIMTTVSNGMELLDIISNNVPHLPSPRFEDEFHHPEPLQVSPSDTWTLVLLTSLRDSGHSLQIGRIRRMLRSALPLTSDLSIIFNEELLEPTKIEEDVNECWILGQNWDTDEIELEEVDERPGQDIAKVVSEVIEGHPAIKIDGIDGNISGQISLYDGRITGGKSEQLGASNGFVINILGRVINLEYADFGLDNLHHGTWAQFRATIRADGLDGFLGVEREALRDSRPVRTFRRFLMAAFNTARNALSASQTAAWPRAGDILDGSWKAIPMKPLAEVVQERLHMGTGIPESIDVGDVTDFPKALRMWNETVDGNPGDLISKVTSQPFDQQLPFMKYTLTTRELAVNESHPYFISRNGSLEERTLLQDFALTDFLTELYLISNNIDSVVLDEARNFRDEFLTSLAQLRRRTGPEISEMLLDATSNSRALEIIVGDALSFLGFIVTPLGANGEPEGIAKAPLSHREAAIERSFTFTYDAKSTGRRNDKVKTTNVKTGALQRHRIQRNADYTLVVAPDFESGALVEECRQNQITPMRALDLGKLLLLSAVSGNLDFNLFKSLFNIHDPDDVHEWVKKFVATANAKEYLSIGSLLQAFDDMGVEGPDELQAAVIADRIRSKTQNVTFPDEYHVRDAVRGLGVFLPSIVKINNKQIYLSASAVDIRQALLDQLQRMPSSMRNAMELDL